MVKIIIEGDGGETKEFEVSEKAFKSGSRGYGAYGKVEMNGSRYQMSCNIVEIGEAHTAPPAAKPKDDDQEGEEVHEMSEPDDEKDEFANM